MASQTSRLGRGERVTREEAERLRVLAREAKLVGPDALVWVERLEPERDGLVDAARFLAEGGEDEAAAELAANVWRLWLLSGDVAGGRRLLAAALDAGRQKPSRWRALALYGDGLLAFRAGALAESKERNDKALQAARSAGDREAEALALVGLSRVAFRNGDYALVRSLAARARELVRDFDPASGLAPLHMLAAGTRLDGDYDEAVNLYTQSLNLYRRLGDQRGVAMELHNIGHVELHRGNVHQAKQCFAECAEIRTPDDPYEAAMTHLNNAALALVRGETEHAAELLQRMQAGLDGAEIVLDPDDAFEVLWLQHRLR